MVLSLFFFFAWIFRTGSASILLIYFFKILFKGGGGVSPPQLCYFPLDHLCRFAVANRDSFFLFFKQPVMVNAQGLA